MDKGKPSPSALSIEEANRNKLQFSGHGSAKGSAGYIDLYDDLEAFEHLAKRGDMIALSPPSAGFQNFTVGCAWDNAHIPDTSFFGKILKRVKHANVDLDLGCLFELQDGHKGALQAFGELHGALNAPPYIALSDDDRTGNTQGDDEILTFSGTNWEKIKRVLLYVYIYNGAEDFYDVKPQIQVRVPNHKPMVVTLGARHEDMDICAIASLENVRNGIKLTNHTEYFNGHAEMDRAFGYGIEWEDGQKQGAPPPHKSRI